VGNVFTRSAWAGGIMDELDKDGDACISWAELGYLSLGGKE
jgi:hypothetical protein